MIFTKSRMILLAFMMLLVLSASESVARQRVQSGEHTYATGRDEIIRCRLKLPEPREWLLPIVGLRRSGERAPDTAVGATWKGEVDDIECGGAFQCLNEEYKEEWDECWSDYQDILDRIPTYATHFPGPECNQCGGG